jgi:glyoxylase-like metal-dependent hydrolase (beta-lactamase superfamily II)
MAGIPLEDNFTDILGKAQRGLWLADTELARRAAVTAAQLRAAKSGLPAEALAKSGEIDEAVIRNLAAALNLGADALVASARRAWRPRDPGPLDGFACFTTPFSDMTVNAYLVFDPKSRQAAAFDTGADADPMLQFIRDNHLKLELILLTHTHTDHVFDLDRLKAATGATAFVSEREPMHGAETFTDGKVFTVGGLKIETRRTSGHARGGTTFVVNGFTPTPRSGLAPNFSGIAVVGDALFAGSMGGGLVDYEEALRTNRAGIFTLPDETILCPGHGPLTTVGEEKLHNPFFPEFQQPQAAQQQQ